MESSYFFKPECDNIKSLIRYVVIALLILTIFSFIFISNSKGMVIFIQILNILCISYLVYLISYPKCSAKFQPKDDNRSIGERIGKGIDNINENIKKKTQR